jgi:RNA polymerase sigma factor (sigma-70 family)
MLSSVSKRYPVRTHETDTLHVYLRDIARLPRLTPEEERSLAARARRDRDASAVGRLVESNLRFVVSCARRYRGFNVSLLDLIHAGNVGLIEAARRFDPARNVKFITYAVWWIREAMMHELCDGARAVSLPPKRFAALGPAWLDVSLSDPARPGDSRERQGTGSRSVAVRSGRRRAPHATGDRRPHASVAGARTADRVARQGQAAAAGAARQPPELTGFL